MGDTTRRSGCPARRHGTAAAYTGGCRCADAREAWRLYNKRRREGRQPPFHHDATGTRRRLQALVAIGWPTAALAGRLGIPSTEVSRLCHHAHRVYPHTIQRVGQLYTQLSMNPGPSRRARRRAEVAGWAPPLAWDDNTIDDPAATPAAHGAERTTPRPHDIDEAAVLRACDGNPPRRLTAAERVQAVRRLAAAGHVDADIARRLRLGGARVVVRIRSNNAIPAVAPLGSRCVTGSQQTISGDIGQ